MECRMNGEDGAGPAEARGRGEGGQVKRGEGGSGRNVPPY